MFRTSLPPRASGGRVGRSSAGARHGHGVGAEHAVGEQAQAGEVREAWPLGDAGKYRQVELGGEPRDGQVVTDRAFQHGAGGHSARWPAVDGAGERRPGALAQQVPEPHWVEADRDDHPVERDPLAFLLVVDLDDDLGLDRFEADDAAGQRADRLGPVEHLLDLDGEHAAVGALEELAAVTPLPITHTSTGPPRSSASSLVQKVRPSRMRGWSSGWPGRRSGLPGPVSTRPSQPKWTRSPAGARAERRQRPSARSMPSTAARIGSTGTRAATQPRYRLHWRWLGRGRPRSTQSAKPSWWMR